MTSRSFPTENIASRILLVRRQRVMLDAHLAELYGVTTKALIQAVKRNLNRFPSDFMFVLTDQDVAILRSQIVTSSSGSRQWGGRRWATYAFTEQGVAMLSSVLRSARAIAANIAIMRTFVRVRQIVSVNAGLAKKLDELEGRVSGHDEAIAEIVRAIRQLATPEDARPARRIGFV
jgi:predicted transcriptional regulator